MTRKGRRLVALGAILGVVGCAVGLILWGLSASITFFNSPSDVVERHVPPGQRIRLGGLVQEGSIQRLPGEEVRFVVTDGRTNLAVGYRGVLPDLFREGQGVVAEGALTGPGEFRATTILARHDENYMPREVADALRRAGHFNPGQGAAAPAAEAAR
jgi:cytochrome c-type biogenesis protein CcmE